MHIYIYPEWSNTIEFIEINESFRTVALHDMNLHNVIKNLSMNENNVKLALDQKYIAQSIGTKLPFLPIITIEEKKVFTILHATHSMNVSPIMSAQNNHVDGITIFPKLEVYLRMYVVKQNKNKKIEAYILASKNGIKNLRTLFQFTTPIIYSTANNSSSTYLNYALNTNHILEVSNQNNTLSKSNTYQNIQTLNNNQLPHSEIIDFEQRRSEMIGRICIGQDSIVSIASLHRYY